jgi:hypothetical protein
MPWSALATGAAVGAVLGLLIGRARACSSAACRVRPVLVFSMIAGAFFGAAVAYWFAAGR